MRITPVTGDLPVVAQLTDPPVERVWVPSPAPPAVTAPAATSGAGAGTSRDARQERPRILTSFDPPLIAQRAVLGLPVGRLIAEHAKAEGIPYGQAEAAVDREMPPGDAQEL